MRTQITKLVPLFLILMLVAVMGGPALAAPPTQEQGLVETVVEDGRFTTLVNALEATGLDETLQAEGPFTIFAPTDEAFARLPAGQVEELFANTPALADLLFYHVVEGAVSPDQLTTQDSLKSFTGTMLTVKSEEEAIQVGDGQVVGSPLEASNGLVYVVDTVLLPPKQDNLVNKLVNDGRFTTLVNALEATGLDKTLQDEGPFTFFAPPDEAFARLPAEQVESLFANTPALTDLLLYHVVNGVLPTDQVKEQDNLTTLTGKLLAVTTEEDTLYVSGAALATPNVETANGIIHIIDGVLIPPTTSPESQSAEGAVTCQAQYVVQAEDWLSKIAEKFLGDLLAYPQIMEATNAAAGEDTAYTTIDNPDVIEVGQVLCIPPADSMMMEEDGMEQPSEESTTQ